MPFSAYADENGRTEPGTREGNFFFTLFLGPDSRAYRVGIFPVFPKVPVILSRPDEENRPTGLPYRKRTAGAGPLAEGPRSRFYSRPTTEKASLYQLNQVAAEPEILGHRLFR